MMLTACSLQVAILSKYRTPSNDSVFQVQRSPLIIEHLVNWSRPLEVINFKVLFPFKALQSPEFPLLLKYSNLHNEIISLQVIALSVVGLVVVVVAMVIMIRTLGTMILHQVRHHLLHHSPPHRNSSVTF